MIQSDVILGPEVSEKMMGRALQWIQSDVSEEAGQGFRADSE